MSEKQQNDADGTKSQEKKRNNKGTKKREGKKRRVSNLHLSRNPNKQEIERDPAQCSQLPP